MSPHSILILGLRQNSKYKLKKRKEARAEKKENKINTLKMKLENSLDV